LSDVANKLPLIAKKQSLGPGNQTARFAPQPTFGRHDQKVGPGWKGDLRFASEWLPIAVIQEPTTTFTGV